MSSDKTNNWNAVIVALLGMVGVLLTALIGLMGSQRAATELIISATQTAKVEMTATSPTDAPTSLLTDLPVLVGSTITPVETPVMTLVQVTTVPEPTTANLDIIRFPVEASIPKNRTGITVNPGDQIAVEYLDGQWTGQKTNPGMSMGCQSSSTDPNTSHIYPLPLEQWGDSLIGYIGVEPFGIGCQPLQMEALTDGELYLGMNDCLNCFWDNDGIIYVNISVKKQ